MRNWFFLLILGGLVVLIGCGKSVELQTKFIEVQSLHVSPTDVEVPINSEIQFYAIAVDKEGNPQKVNVEWSLYGGVGTIDATGRFKSSARAGYGSVYAKYGAFQAYSFIEVTPGSLASISISPASVTLGVGDSYTFTATGEDSYGNRVDVSPTWSVEGGIGSFSDSYYDLTAKGVRFMSSSYSAYAYFTAAAAGSGTIKAQVGSVEAAASVQVISITPYTYISQWLTKIGTETAVPKGTAVGPDGNIWVTMYTSSYSDYTYKGGVSKYDASGNFISSLEGAVSGEGSLEVPNDLVFDSSGNIYVVDYNANKIKKYNSGGNFVLSWGGSGSGTGKFYSPARIAIDGSNYIYIADHGNDRVQKFDSSGNFILEWGGYGNDPGEFSGPTGIVIDSGGYVYVADKYNSRIQKFDSSGNFIASWGKYGSGIGEFDSPIGMAIDGANNLFIVDEGYDRVYKYDNSGNFLTRWGEYGASNGKFSGPIDVAVDNTGNVYVVDVYNYRIQKFRP